MLKSGGCKITLAGASPRTRRDQNSNRTGVLCKIFFSPLEPKWTFSFLFSETKQHKKHIYAESQVTSPQKLEESSVGPESLISPRVITQPLRQFSCAVVFRSLTSLVAVLRTHAHLSMSLSVCCSPRVSPRPASPRPVRIPSLCLVA